MAQTVEQALKAAKLYSDGRDYVFVRLPAAAITAAASVVAEAGEPFCGLIVDKDEVSLMLPAEVLADMAHRLPGHIASPQPYRLITVDAVLDFSLVGFMAWISRALADGGISILPFAAYTRDHIFVPADQFVVARDVLEKLKSG